jgi:3-oxoacyl-[acyl-carrier protein] reductase
LILPLSLRREAGLEYALPGRYCIRSTVGELRLYECKIQGEDVMELNLHGRTALITGASKGIGLSSAECLAEEGVNVILVSRTQADLDAAREKIAARWNVNVQTHAYDLSDSRNVDRLVAEHPDIDILVNNAGAIPGGNLQEITEDRWRLAWDLKVFGYVNMCRRFYAEMKTRGRGVIINVLGVAGEKMDATYIAGSTGNAALMAFTKAIGGAAPGDKLRVVGINPGAIATERLVTMMRKRAQDRLGDADRWEELMKPLPFGRAGKPEEIGWMVAFLASDKSSYTTGTILTVDGGVANRGPMF